MSGADTLQPFSTLSSEHPRLLLKAGEWTALKERIDNRDPQITFLWEQIRGVADDCLDREPVTRKLKGRRLLGVSRLTLKRIGCLAIAYRLTDDTRYLDRAVVELDAVCAFSDWNPSHFLDVAEMAAAVGTGYDWLYHELTPDQRQRYRTALLEKALVLGLNSEKSYTWWISGTNNWNQVCHGGLTLAALAIADEDGGDIPERIVIQAIENIGVAMQEYEPDGGYPEGAGYWDYGTTYNVLFLDVLESALGSDFGVTDPFPGFIKTAEFRAQMNTPAGLRYNFGDSSIRLNPAPTLFWFDHPRVNRMEYQYMKEAVPSTVPNARSSSGRMTPFQLIWLSRVDLTAAGAPLPLVASWRGRNPVAVFRTSWTDPDASFLTLKGGKATINHGHMDAGSFVFESDGVRWSLDLPHGSYHALETQGVGLWNRQQDSDRWTLKAWSTLGHNLLRFPGYNPDVDGGCKWSEKSLDAPDPGISVDLTALYPQFYDTYERQVELHGNGSAVITDRVRGLAAPVNPQWTMLTRADIVTDATGATLSQDGKTLRVDAECSEELQISWETAEKPLRAEDFSHPGLRRLIIESLANTGSLDLTVRLIPKE